MKIFKRIICGISTLAMCLSITPLSASAAATYWTGDVNGDGTVDMLDVTCMQRYLTGKSGANGATCERLDVNQNYIIDKNDKDALLSIIIHTSSSQQKSYQNTTMTATNLQKKYRKFNAQTGAKIGSDYTLNKVNNIASTSASTYSIISDDNRKVDYNKSGVVKLTYQVGNETKHQTGFIVDTHTILTAASCVFDTTNNTPHTNLKYTLYEAVEPDDADCTEYNVVSYHVPVDYINDDMGSNYALITVDENLNSYRCFDLGVCRDGVISNSNSEFLSITGFSGANSNGAIPSLLNDIVTGKGKFVANSDGKKITSNTLNYDVDTVDGTYGAPVYTTDTNGNMTVIGINNIETNTTGSSGVLNSARRIDSTILHFIYNNDNL